MKTKDIPIGGRMRVLPQNVILLAADLNYTRLYLQDGQELIVATTLKKLEKRLVFFQNFFRSHRSHIVNLDYLSIYKPNDNKIIMQNDMTVLLSRRRKNAFQLKISIALK